MPHSKSTIRIGPMRVWLTRGQIVAVCGPSGSGKSTALEELAARCPSAVCVNRISFPPEAAVVDGIAPWADLNEAVGLLTVAGLGDARLWLRRFEELSEGERFRARLARGLAIQTRHGAMGPLLCDEFCSSLDPRSARAISHGLRKLVTRRRLCVVTASSHTDLLTDLQPDGVVRLQGEGRWEYEECPPPVPRPVSFLRRMQIRPGCKTDYEEFAGMHYRSAEELGFVEKVFLLSDGPSGDMLGIVVYGYGPLELSLRNQATQGYFSQQPRRLNRDLRILRRLVIRPDVRGCGLGQYLVRRTLPLAGTRYVECLASMGEFNPVFEKAGMRRIGQIEISPQRMAALNALRALNIDVNNPDFPERIRREDRVRMIVTDAVADWYAAITGNGRRRAEVQSPRVLAQTFRGLAGSRPVYYLWKRPTRG